MVESYSLEIEIETKNNSRIELVEYNQVVEMQAELDSLAQQMLLTPSDEMMDEIFAKIF